VVEFGVLPDGQTDAVIVVDAEPPLLFEGTALRAVRKWRYEKDPKAAEAQRQVVRIVFRLPGKSDSDEVAETEPESIGN
jgi:TonB family protein